MVAPSVSLLRDPDHTQHSALWYHRHRHTRFSHVTRQRARNSTPLYIPFKPSERNPERAQNKTALGKLTFIAWVGLKLTRFGAEVHHAPPPRLPKTDAQTIIIHTEHCGSTSTLHPHIFSMQQHPHTHTHTHSFAAKCEFYKNVSFVCNFHSGAHGTLHGGRAWLVTELRTCTIYACGITMPRTAPRTHKHTLLFFNLHSTRQRAAHACGTEKLYACAAVCLCFMHARYWLPGVSLSVSLQRPAGHFFTFINISFFFCGVHPMNNSS